MFDHVPPPAFPFRDIPRVSGPLSTARGATIDSGRASGAPIAAAKSASEMCIMKGAASAGLTAKVGLGLRIEKAGVPILPLLWMTAPSPQKYVAFTCSAL